MTKRVTRRLEYLRQTKLEEDEVRLLNNIEEFDCGVVHIKEEPCVPSWAFTVGVYDTLGQPEIIVVGLKEDVAHFVLNKIRSRFRDGTRFIEGQREQGLLEHVECELREVNARWLQRLMGFALWFYGPEPFPVIQCVYPDLKGLFPWEDGFDESWRSRQPLLFNGAPETTVEKQFWEANEPGSPYDGWIFSDPPHTRVFTTQRINEQQEPITYVTHDTVDGAWQFHGESESGSPVVICFHHIVDRDPTIKELVDLPRGWYARRSKVGDPWKRELAPPEVEEER